MHITSVDFLLLPYNLSLIENAKTSCWISHLSGYFSQSHRFLMFHDHISFCDPGALKTFVLPPGCRNIDSVPCHSSGGFLALHQQINLNIYMYIIKSSAFLLCRVKTSMMCQWTLLGEKTVENTFAFVHECYTAALILYWCNIPQVRSKECCKTSEQPNIFGLRKDILKFSNILTCIRMRIMKTCILQGQPKGNIFPVTAIVLCLIQFNLIKYSTGWDFTSLI